MDLRAYDFGATGPGADLDIKAINKAVERSVVYCFVGAPTRKLLDRVATGHMAVFRGAADEMYYTTDGDTIGTDVERFFEALDISVSADVAPWVAANAGVVRNQASARLGHDYTMKPFMERQLRASGPLYMDPIEFFVQSGFRYSAPHYDYGRVFGFIPQFCSRAIKIWVSVPYTTNVRSGSDKDGAFMRMVRHPDSTVIIQYPGDVVYQAPLSKHAVLLGYKTGTQPHDQWCTIGGNLFILQSDRYEAHVYCTRVAMTARKDSKEAWEQVVRAFAIMEGRFAPDEDAENLDFDTEYGIFDSLLKCDARYNATNAKNASKKIKRKQSWNDQLVGARKAKLAK